MFITTFTRPYVNLYTYKRVKTCAKIKGNF